MTAVLAIVRRVPVWAWVLLVLLAWGAWQRHQARSIERKHTAAVAAAAQERESKLQADAAETARRLAAQKGATDDATKTNKALAVDAARARAAEQRVRQQLAALTANSGTSDPASAAASAPAGETVTVLANMLGRCVSRARELAEYADAARTAGETCERSYEALTMPGHGPGL